jgi:subtilisin family serine protease
MYWSRRHIALAPMIAAAGLAAAWLILSDAKPAAADPGTATGGSSSLPILLPGGSPGGGGGGVGPPSGGGSGVPLPPPPPGCCAGGGGSFVSPPPGGGGGNGGGVITTPAPSFGIPGLPPTDQPVSPSVSPDELVVVFAGTLPRQVGEQFAADHNSKVVDYFQLARLNLHVFLLSVRDSQFARTLNEMMRDPRPLWVQTNSAFGASPTNTAYLTPTQKTMQYALDRLHVAPVLDITRGMGVTIAIVDSGVDVAHEAFAGARISVLDVISKPETLVTTPTPEVHGTAIASIIVGHGKLLGIAPEVELLAIRAFHQVDGSGGAARSNSFYLSKGISTAIDHGVRVINLSLTGPQDRLVAQTVEQALMSKIAVVAAAGNAGPGAPPAYPAAQAGVIAVTATDGQDHLYKNANRGSYVTLAAPGVDILVAKPGGYGYLSGTSMATAYVSGLSALMIARSGDLTPTRLRKLLEATATDLGAPERDPDYGAGRVDAEAAFSHLAEN